MQNALKSNEWQGTLVLITFKIEIQKRGPTNSASLQNCFPQEIRSNLFNLWKFEKPEKSTLQSCRMYWNLINGEEFRSLQFSKMKHSRWDQIIQPFCRIHCPKEISSLLFNLWKFQKSVKSTSQSCKMDWNVMNEKNLGS